MGLRSLFPMNGHGFGGHGGNCWAQLIAMRWELRSGTGVPGMFFAIWEMHRKLFRDFQKTAPESARHRGEASPGSKSQTDFRVRQNRHPISIRFALRFLYDSVRLLENDLISY